MRNQIITHAGVVQAAGDECVRVRILQSSACAGCAAKQMCSSAEAKEKIVDVLTAEAGRYSVGQEVLLEGRLADGRLAALVAYGLPLLLLLPVLFFAVWLTGSEMQAALWSLAVVALYYLCIYLFFRRRLQSRFEFRIREAC